MTDTVLAANPPKPRVMLQPRKDELRARIREMEAALKLAVEQPKPSRWMRWWPR